MQIKQILLKLSLLFIVLPVAHAQYDPDVVKSIVLDSVVVQQVKRGFSVEDFIFMVQNDTSFGYAFQNLRFTGYTSENHIEIFDKRNRLEAEMRSKTKQYYSNRCRWIETLNEQTQGKLLNRKNEHRFYTVELFDYLFLGEDTICNQKRGYASDASTEKKAEHSEMLKTLIFNPGSDVQGVPLIGNRLAIFDPDVAKYYDFGISAVTYKDSVECYIFTLKRKQGVSKDKVIIQQMSTWFSRKTFNVMARNYEMSYSNILFDFDVKMRVDLAEIGGEVLPQYINYSGYWDVPLRKPEIANFEIKFSEFTNLYQAANTAPAH